MRSGAQALRRGGIGSPWQFRPSKKPRRSGSGAFFIAGGAAGRPTYTALLRSTPPHSANLPQPLRMVVRRGPGWHHFFFFQAA